MLDEIFEFEIAPRIIWFIRRTCKRYYLEWVKSDDSRRKNIFNAIKNNYINYFSSKGILSITKKNNLNVAIIYTNNDLKKSEIIRQFIDFKRNYQLFNYSRPYLNDKYIDKDCRQFIFNDYIINYYEIIIDAIYKLSGTKIFCVNDVKIINPIASKFDYIFFVKKQKINVIVGDCQKTFSFEIRKNLN